MSSRAASGARVGSLASALNSSGSGIKSISGPTITIAEPGGLLALQNELGRAIAQQVQVQLTPSYGNRSVNKYAANPEAYELYLKGRFYLNKRTFPEIEKSTEYFQESIRKDPGFALAYAGLADSYLANAITSPPDFDPKAKAAAARALELDDGLAEAHAALGAVNADFEYDWPGAERELKRAIELNPNYADGHWRYAWSYLTPLGKSDQAIAEMKKALELDPFSRMDNTILGCIYFYGRNTDQALQQFENAIKLNPDFFVTYYHLAWLYSDQGRYPGCHHRAHQRAARCWRSTRQRRHISGSCPRRR